MPGETSAQACLRHLKRELGITDVCASDIEHVSTQLFVWDSRFVLRIFKRIFALLTESHREQAPKEHGTSDVSVLVNVTLPSSALAALVLEKQEYKAAQIFTLHDILTEKLAACDADALPPSLAKLYSEHGGFRFHPAGNLLEVMLVVCAASCCPMLFACSSSSMLRHARGARFAASALCSSASGFGVGKSFKNRALLRC
jgi:hypothetical protein